MLKIYYLTLIVSKAIPKNAKIVEGNIADKTNTVVKNKFQAVLSRTVSSTVNCL